MNSQDQLDQFLNGAPHAVVGASRDRSKYGNKVLRAYLQASRAVYAVNPTSDTVEGLRAYPNLTELPEVVYGVSIITPPGVTQSIVEQAGQLGITNLWMQPGAESDLAIARAKQLGMNVIAGGPCILVALKYHE